ncbi:MAG TPA: hypothetical protein DEB31_03560 [Clostridiales bacterium]|nr:hypothetical protein [Clostridiales bacterium]
MKGKKIVSVLLAMLLVLTLLPAVALADDLSDAKAAKNTAIDEMLVGYVEADYVAGGWTTLQTAITTARQAIDAASDVNGVNAVDLTPITSALGALTAGEGVIDGLKADAKSRVTAYLAEQGVTAQGNYTSTSWALLSATVTAMEGTIDGLTTAAALRLHGSGANDYDSLDAAIATLETAAALDAAKTTMKATVNALDDELVAGDYTSVTWSAMTGAISSAVSAIDALDVIASVTGYDYSAVTAAITSLVIDSTALGAAVTTAKTAVDTYVTGKSLTQSEYTVYSWTAFQNVITAEKVKIDTAAAVSGALPSVITAYDDHEAAIDTAVGNLETTVDFSAAVTAAETAIDSYVTGLALVETDYESGAWSTFQTAIGTEKTTVATKDTIAAVTAYDFQAGINSAKTTLESGISSSALATAKSDKATAIDGYVTSKALTEGDWTAASWTDLQTVITAQKTTALESFTLASQVVAYTGYEAAINAAIEALDTAAELTAAIAAKKEAIDQYVTAKGLTAADYTNWDATVATAVTNAKAAVDALTTTAAVEAYDAYETTIDTAIGQLTVDATVLGTLKTAAKARIDAYLTEEGVAAETVYTVTSWGLLNTAVTTVENAIDALTDPNAVRAHGTGANDYATIDAAILTLETKADLLAAQTTQKEAVNALIDGLVQGDYTTASWTAVTDAIDAAESAINALDVIASVTGYDYSAVTTAITDLAVDPTALANAQTTKKAAIAAMADTLTESEYTTASWAALQDAISNAKDAVDLLATPAAVRAYVADGVTTAINNLVALELGELVNSDADVTVTEDATLGELITNIDAAPSNGSAAMTAADLIGQFDSSAITAAGCTIAVLDKDGDTAADSMPVGTGTVIQLLNSDGEVISSITVVIMGDIQGNGKADVGDYVLLAQAASQVEPLTGVYLKAADINGNDRADVGDYVRLAQMATPAE